MLRQSIYTITTIYLLFMKIQSLFRVFLPAVLFIIFLSSMCPAQTNTGFDPALQKALNSVVTQKDQTQRALGTLRNKLRGNFNSIPAVPEDPALRGFVRSYDTIAEIFNKIIATTKNGDAAAVSATQNSISTGVSINHGFIRDAIIKLEVSFPQIDTAALTESWQMILQSSQTLDKKNKKKLYKYLNENAKWKMSKEL